MLKTCSSSANYEVRSFSILFKDVKKCQKLIEMSSGTTILKKNTNSNIFAMLK